MRSRDLDTRANSRHATGLKGTRETAWTISGYRPDHTLAHSHAVPGTKGFELLAELPHPADYDFFVWKGVEPDMHPYGACYHDLAERQSTGIIEYLQAKKITTVIIGGLATDYCVRHTALQLLKAGIEVVINLAATRGVAEDSTDQALKELQQAGVHLVQNAAELGQKLEQINDR